MFWVNLQDKTFECLDAPLVCTKCGFVSELIVLDRFIDDRRVCYACWGQPWKQPAGRSQPVPALAGGIYLGKLSEFVTFTIHEKDTGPINSVEIKYPAGTKIGKVG